MPEPPPGTTTRGLAAEVLGVIVLYAAAVAFVRPYGNFSVDDDTYFGLPALAFARTGHFHLTFAPHSLRAQILWGALFVRLFGQSFESLRVASMVSMTIAIVMLHATLRNLPVSRGVRLFGVVAFAFHPLLFWSSNTFMTETHFVCASVMAMYFYVRGLQEERLSLLLLAGAGVALSWWVRQTGIMTALPAPALLLLFRGRLLQRWKQALVVCLLPIATFAFIYLLRPDWLMSNSSEFYGLMHMWRESTFRLPDQLALMRHYVFLTLLNQALFFAPLVVLAGAAVVGQYTRSQMIGVAVVVLFFGYGVAELLRAHVPMPFDGDHTCCDITLGNTFTNFGLGPPTLPGGFGDGPLAYPFRLGYGARVLLTMGAGLLAAILSVAAIRPLRDAFREPKRHAGLLLAAGYIVAHTAGLCVSAAYFDRYSLSSAWPVVIIAALLATARPLRLPAAAVLLAVVVFSVFSVNEFYSWQRARWTAFFDLRREGIAVAEIQAGTEPRDLYGGLAYNFDIHAHRRAVYGIDNEKARYLVGFAPPPGSRVLRSYPFSGWLGLHRAAVYVVDLKK